MRSALSRQCGVILSHWNHLYKKKGKAIYYCLSHTRCKWEALYWVQPFLNSNLVVNKWIWKVVTWPERKWSSALGLLRDFNFQHGNQSMCKRIRVKATYYFCLTMQWAGALYNGNNRTSIRSNTRIWKRKEIIEHDFILWTKKVQQKNWHNAQ